MSQLITASRLQDGAVVFLGSDGIWVERLDRAMLLDDKDAVARGLAQGSEAEASNIVLDVYAIDVSTKSGAVVPTKLREAIRARGPTIHPELAKPGSQPPVAEEDDHVSV